MNTSLLAKAAYAAPGAAVRTHQSVEYDAFVRVTSALKQAHSAPARVTALHTNRELWNLLAVDVASDDNQLPNALRAQIFYLAEFTSQHTSKVLAGKAEMDALVDINTAIMRGLRQQRERVS